MPTNILQREYNQGMWFLVKISLFYDKQNVVLRNQRVYIKVWIGSQML